MTAHEFKVNRKKRGWTQKAAAAALDVSQSYVALLENGQRKLTTNLLNKAVRKFQVSPTALPCSKTGAYRANSERVVKDLGALGYPGFSYMSYGRVKNPAEVLLNALSLTDLEARAAEALPWLLLKFDTAETEGLVREARGRAVQNRLGFVVDLAKAVLERRGEVTTPRYQSLARLSATLREAPLANEDTFFQNDLSPAQLNWLQETRPEMAKQWKLLTDWKPEFLQYTNAR